MLESIITSKTRVKLLLKFFLNSETISHLRGMQKEFGESTNAIHQELNRLKDAGLLSDFYKSNKRYYKANTNHPLYEDIHNILVKMVGIDKIIDRITSKIGNLESAYLTGSFANGIDSDTIELVLAGDNLDENYIKTLVAKAEELIKKKIMYLVLTKEQTRYFFMDKPILLIWSKDNP